MRLHNYQHRMCEHIIKHPRCALWAEMGLGKTIATLYAIQHLFNHMEISNILILGPPKVIEKVWPDEIKKWGINLPYAVLKGNAKQRYRVMNLNRHVTLCSVFNLAWLAERNELNFYDMIVLDEAHYFKSSTSQRYLTMMESSEDVSRIVELTGTPAGTGLLDIWSQLSILDDGDRLGHPYSYYRDRFFESDYMGYKWTLRTGAKEEIYDAVGDICTSLKATEYLSMPEIITTIVPVELPPASQAQYKSLQRDFLLSLEDVDIIAGSAATLTQKLQQAASGAIYDEDGLVHDLHSFRVDALEEVVASNAGEPILVTYAHRFQIKQIQDKFPKAVVVDTINIDAWNAGEIPVLICHWSNLGLNLQDGGHILIMYGLTWSLTDYLQTIARIWRQGQEKPVMIYQIVCMGTVDEVMIRSIADKETNQSELIERVRMQCQS